jgi:integrase
MASISTDANGHRIIQFIAGDRKRRSVRLGPVSLREAREIKGKIAALNVAAIAHLSMDAHLAEWVAGLEPLFYDKLAGVGLLPARPETLDATLAAFITGHIGKRTDVKPATKEVWRQGAKGLVDFFGADKPLREITPGQADEYKLHLIGEGLATMTVRKRLQFAKMIFRSAVRHKLVGADPFADVTIKATMPDRSRFVTAVETAALVEACPDHDWRLIVALARWGGLRCPSEVLSLRWQDIDWERGRIVVQSPKTEHHPGKATRTIPLFPELRPHLEEAFELAPEGAVYVVDERMRASAQGKAGWRNCNLRTTFEKIIRRAGLTPWPRLFHNLRASRETELARRFPMHVVVAWLGHTQDIALRHYCQVTDADFEAACSAAESGAVGSRNGSHRLATEIVERRNRRAKRHGASRCDL